MSTIAKRVEAFGTTIFTEINMLALQHNAINLGQGRPDFDGPQAAIDAFIQALQSGNHNQYAPGPGTPKLRQAIARHASTYGLEVPPDGGVIVTPGATNAIFSSVIGLVDAGDEVIIIEPFFDSYVPNVTMVGAKPIFVSLRPPEWTFDVEELKAAFNEKTRAIILNTPQNPTGRVFTREELQLIADLCIQHDVTVISDEVYENLTFDNAQHIPIATLPGMFERTITIGSAGKTFGMTGWKLGWVYGHPDIVKGMARAYQFMTFAVNHVAQEAIAHAFTLNDELKAYYALYDKKRNLMMQGLEAAGLKPFLPSGTYFITADFSDVFDGNDVDFARHITKEIGVACIPPSAFFSENNRHIAAKQARFSFCKDDDTIEAAMERLQKLNL